MFGLVVISFIAASFLWCFLSYLYIFFFWPLSVKAFFLFFFFIRGYLYDSHEVRKKNMRRNMGTVEGGGAAP